MQPATDYAILVGFLGFTLILGASFFGIAPGERFGAMSIVVDAFDAHL